MDLGLKEACVLVTGAAGGIGQATARALAAEGARVVVHYRTSKAVAEVLAQELGGPSVALGADLREEDQVAELFRQARLLVGPVDHVVVNAGIWQAEERPLHTMTLEQWRHTLDSDLTSAFLTCREFLRGLAAEPREQASLVLIGSTAALFGEADHADYATAKAGMVYGLLRSLKNEIVRLAPQGRVNAVCPGWTVTPMAAEEIARPEVRARVTATMPMKKVANPEDVAHTIVSLLSPTISGHTSGAIVPVAGGMEGRLLVDG